MILALVLAHRGVHRTPCFQRIERTCRQYVAVFTKIDGTMVVCGAHRMNRLLEGPKGRGLVVLDVEEAVQLGDLE